MINTEKIKNIPSFIEVCESLTEKELIEMQTNENYPSALDCMVCKFIARVVYEQRFYYCGSATETKFIYWELLYHRPDLNRTFVLDLGDWAAAYNDNDYCPMDGCGSSVRGHLIRSAIVSARILKEEKESVERKRLKKIAKAAAHAERCAKSKERLELYLKKKNGKI